MVSDYSHCVRYAMEHPDEAAHTLEGRIPGMLLGDIRHGLERDGAGWTWDTALDHDFIGRIVAELTEQEIVPPAFDPDPFLAQIA